MDSLPSGSGSTDIFISRNTLFKIMREKDKMKLEDQFKYLKARIKKRTSCPNEHLPSLNNSLSKNFISQFKKRWEKSARHYEKFVIDNKEWLTNSVSFINYKHLQKNKAFGRKTHSFIESSDRTKRRKTEHLRTHYGSDELSYATQMSLRNAKKIDASKIVKEITFSSPNRAFKYRDALEKHKEKVQLLSGEEALAMIVDAKLTRHQYNIIRDKDPLKFPPYKLIQATKKKCYPEKESISIDSTKAEVKLQALLDHTASRILESQMEVLETQDSKKLCNLTLISKWGFDGSSCQSTYKQKFKEEKQTDGNMFLTSLVPIQLFIGEPEKKGRVILWQNPRTSSTRFCRPIKFEFVRETAENSIAEQEYIENQIQELMPSEFRFKKTGINVKHKLLFTMVDGKICNSVTGTKSTQMCYICGLTSKSFNNLVKVFATKVDVCKLEFGLSTLHAWIRFFECLLHLSYKLPFKKWQARSEDEKKIVAIKKREIQEKFKNQLGLIVDKPKPGGYGNSNDGNTARRFFQNTDLTANITGIEKDLIKRFYIVLQTISCGYKINLGKFETFVRATAQLYVEKYPWYPMPPTLHKILIHGPLVISNALLPIGQLSEEAQEARNKDFRKFREGHTRKISRTKTNEDIFNLLLITSDPYISSIRHQRKTKLKTLSKEVLDMLDSPDINAVVPNDESSGVAESTDECETSTDEDLF